MLKKIKPLFPALGLCAVFSFMLTVFEPLMLYASDSEDFWFDVYDIIPELVTMFLAFTLVPFLFFFLAQSVESLTLKKSIIYRVLVLIFFGVFVVTYIQGNFLAGSLPGIDGTPFNWRDYWFDSIISVVLWVAACGGLIFAVKKFSLEKVFNLVPKVTLAIFAMLTVSLVATMATTPGMFDNKETSKASFDFYNRVSSNRNFFIFMVDAVDSRTFDELLKDTDQYKEVFKDFTYFEDAMSYYPYTRDSVPEIFSSLPNNNETLYVDYSHKAYAESEILHNLADDGYKMGFYDDSAMMSYDTAAMFDNMSRDTQLRSKNFSGAILRYDLFKYLPFPLKGKVHIERLSFRDAKLADGQQEFFWDNVLQYDILKNESAEVVDDKVFNFIHIEGGHVPFDVDENVNRIKNGTYAQKLTATMNIIKAYVDRLKDAGAYDNASIVIMADHGLVDVDDESAYVMRRFNPIFYVKGVGEQHSAMLRSDKPISYADLNDAFDQLRLGAKSTELFADIENPRTRTLVYYYWTNKDHMVEYTTDGKAWDDSKMVPTGRVFDR